jgi:hypothetical protein
VLKKTLVAGCSKTLRYKATEIPACSRQAEEGNAEDGRFSATCLRRELG